MAFKRPRRGISVGTVATISLCVVTLLLGAFVFSRISGDISEIKLDPKLLTEPLAMVAGSLGGGEAGGASVQTAGGGGASSAPQMVTVAPTAAPTAAPTPEPIRTLTLAAAGQVSAGSELQAGGFDDVFTPVAGSLGNADLSIVTLRTSLTSDSSAYAEYNAPAALATALSGAGVTAVNMATDRLLDHGTAGLATTQNILAQAGLRAIGAYQTADGRQGYDVWEISGIRVGVLSYTASISTAGRAATAEGDIQTAARLLEEAAALADIRALRAQSDIVIVLAHWGSRGDARATGTVKTLADAFVQAGADVVLGTNPTSVQEMEKKTITDENGRQREVFIAYSLGNLLIDDSRDTTDITGVVLRLSIQWDAQAQRAAITDSRYLPAWIMRWREGTGVNRYQLVAAGTPEVPQHMTDSIYKNMQKAYQSMVNKVGTAAAQPQTTP